MKSEPAFSPAFNQLNAIIAGYSIPTVKRAVKVPQDMPGLGLLEPRPEEFVRAAIRVEHEPSAPPPNNAPPVISPAYIEKLNEMAQCAQCHEGQTVAEIFPPFGVAPELMISKGHMPPGAGDLNAFGPEFKKHLKKLILADYKERFKAWILGK